MKRQEESTWTKYKRSLKLVKILLYLDYSLINDIKVISPN